MFSLTIYEPVNTSNYTLAIICLVLALAAIGALVYMNLQPVKSVDAKSPNGVNKKFKPLFSLLLFFTFLICISTAFFSWLTTTKVTAVNINEEFIETPYGKIDWKDIDRIYVHEDDNSSPFSNRDQGDPTKFLMIIEVNGKTHALSEESYDLKAMGKEIKQMRNK